MLIWCIVITNYIIMPKIQEINDQNNEYWLCSRKSYISELHESWTKYKNNTSHEYTLQGGLEYARSISMNWRGISIILSKYSSLRRLFTCEMTIGKSPALGTSRKFVDFTSSSNSSDVFIYTQLTRAQDKNEIS